MKATLRKPDASVPRVEIQQAGSSLAEELRSDEGSTVVSRHQERHIDGTPWSLQTSFYPLSLVQRGAARLIEASDIQQGSVEYLWESIGIKQVGYRDTVKVRPPDATEARFFGLPDDGGVSVIETRRTAFDESGAPFRLTVSVYPADRNEFAVNVGQVPDEVATPRVDPGPAQSAADSRTVPQPAAWGELSRETTQRLPWAAVLRGSGTGHLAPANPGIPGANQSMRKPEEVSWPSASVVRRSSIGMSTTTHAEE